MKETGVTGYNGLRFANFDAFIKTAKRIQSELDFKAVLREQEITEAWQDLSKIPDYVWKRLEEAGFITLEPLAWEKTKSKQLFAYFVYKACEKFDIKQKFFTKDSRKETLKLKPFEVLFQIPNLKGKIRDCKRDKPIGHEAIDKILQK